MLGKTCLAFFFSLIILFCSTEAYVGRGFEKRQKRGRNVKLFVFGDSYVDAGNCPRSGSVSWRQPYGITFPGKPYGRFSDGRVLTDYIASFLGIKSPMPYVKKKFEAKSIEHGINFAYGGTGVFQTFIDQPNMTRQIDLLQELIDKNIYTGQNLTSSIALVSLGGNDYGTYLARNGSMQGIPSFTRSVVNQLILNVNRIHSLGIKKIAVTGMEPAGCLPRNTASNSHHYCIPEGNNLSLSHNHLLNENLLGLSYNVTYLNIYDAFTTALKLDQNPQGNSTNDLLKPCCVGVNGGDCGLIGAMGEKRYTICEDPSKSFFWDSIHPSNHGWSAVYRAVIPSLKTLLM